MVANPEIIDDYHEHTKEAAYKHEMAALVIEYGEEGAKKLEPNLARPSYLFKKREDSLCKVLL